MAAPRSQSRSRPHASQSQAHDPALVRGSDVSWLSQNAALPGKAVGGQGGRLFILLIFWSLAFRGTLLQEPWQGCQKADSASLEISVNSLRQPKVEQQLEKEMNKCSLKLLRRTLNINECDTLFHVNWKGSCIAAYCSSWRMPG